MHINTCTLYSRLDNLSCQTCLRSCFFPSFFSFFLSILYSLFFLHAEIFFSSLKHVSSVSNCNCVLFFFCVFVCSNRPWLIFSYCNQFFTSRLSPCMEIKFKCRMKKKRTNSRENKNERNDAKLLLPSVRKYGKMLLQCTSFDFLLLLLVGRRGKEVNRFEMRSLLALLRCFFLLLFFTSLSLLSSISNLKSFMTLERVEERGKIRFIKNKMKCEEIFLND